MSKLLICPKCGCWGEEFEDDVEIEDVDSECPKCGEWMEWKTGDK